MVLQRWLALPLSAVLLACSAGDAEEACTPSNVVDDEEISSTTTALSHGSGGPALAPHEQSAVLTAIEGLAGAPRDEAAARVWSEAVSAPSALVRDLVETAWIDGDDAVAARLVQDASLIRSSAAGARRSAVTHTALRRVVAAGDLVLALSDGEQAGEPLRLYDLFRVARGTVVERWSGQQPGKLDAAASALASQHR